MVSQSKLIFLMICSRYLSIPNKCNTYFWGKHFYHNLYILDISQIFMTIFFLKNRPVVNVFSQFYNYHPRKSSILLYICVDFRYLWWFFVISVMRYQWYHIYIDISGSSTSFVISVMIAYICNEIPVISVMMFCDICDEVSVISHLQLQDHQHIWWYQWW